MIRRSLLNKMGGGTVKLLSGGKNSRLAVAGDILLAYDNGTKLMIVDAADYTTSKYPTAQYTRLGTVAVPGDHNVYGDGSCGVVANVTLRAQTIPSSLFSGKIHAYAIATILYVFEASQYKYLSELRLLNPREQLKSGLLPLSAQTGCPIDNADLSNDFYVSWWRAGATGQAKCFPSPYHHRRAGSVDGPEGDKEVLASVLGDFDGLGHCGGRWKGYKTIGTNPGDWYVPAFGELWYTSARIGAVSSVSSSKGEDGLWGSGAYGIVEQSTTWSMVQPFLRVVS